MIDRKIIKFLLRRGTDAERQTVLFENGELVYTTDTKRVYVGDNINLGGNPIFASIKITDGLPLAPGVSDVVYDTITSDTFICTEDGFKPLTNLAPISAIVDSNVSALSAAIDTTNSNVATLSADTDNRIVGLSATIDALSANVFALSASTDTRIIALSTSIDTLSADTNNRIISLSANGATLSANIWSLSANVTTLSTNVGTLSSNVVTLSSSTSSNITSLSANVNTLSASVATLSAAIVSSSILSGAVMSTVSTTATASDTFITFAHSGTNYGIRLWKV